jgi:TonB-dependent starch-binding outer membrane protein SusC
MRNNGLELALNWRDRISNNLKYEIGANFTKISNEVVDLGGGAPINGGNINKVGDLTRTEVGYEIAYFYGLKTQGIFQSVDEINNYKDATGKLIQPAAKPGDVIFTDLNGDGMIGADDRTYLGSATPDFTYAINGSIEFKNIDLRLFFQGVEGAEIANSLYREWYGSDGSTANYHLDRINRWRESAPSATEPRMTVNDPNKNAQFSDRYISDGSYLRLRNVTLGYTFAPGTLGSKLRFRSLRIYVSADNIWTKTAYKGLDPEIGERFSNPLYYGIDLANYPQVKNYRAGVNFNF